MKDIFEAIERLSAQLSYRLEHIAKKSSLAVHFSAYSVSPKPGVLVRIFNTMIHLPKGFAVNFMPRAQPEPDGQSWHIDIRRNDGVARTSFSSGIGVRMLGEGFALTYEGRQLTGDDIHQMLNDLEKPGLSGMALSIARLWSMMYGRMPQHFATRLEAVRDVDLLDRIYDGLVNDAGAELVDALLPGGANAAPGRAPESAKTTAPAQPLAAAPAEPMTAAPAEPMTAAPAEPTNGAPESPAHEAAAGNSGTAAENS